MPPLPPYPPSLDLSGVVLGYRDSFGNAVAGPTLEWSVDAAGAVAVDLSGTIVTALAPGVAILTGRCSAIAPAGAAGLQLVGRPVVAAVVVVLVVTNPLAVTSGTQTPGGQIIVLSVTGPGGVTSGTQAPATQRITLGTSSTGGGTPLLTDLINVQLVIGGDSLSAAEPNWIQEVLADHPTWTHHNAAVSGRTWEQIVAAYPTDTRPFLDHARKIVAIGYEWHNMRSAQWKEIYDLTAQWCDLLRADAVDAIGVKTPISSAGLGEGSAAYEPYEQYAKRMEYRRAMMLGMSTSEATRPPLIGAHADFILDSGRPTGLLGAWNACVTSSIYYNPDRVHLNATGQQVWGDDDAALLNTALAGG